MPASETDTLDLHFPFSGVFTDCAYSRQPNRPAWRKQYARTTAHGKNVRGMEPATKRTRGGSRSGLTRWIDAQPIGSIWVTQELATVATSGFTPAGGAVQTSDSGRVITVVNVTQGNVWVARPGDLVWSSTTNATGNTPPLNSSGLVRSADNQELLFFADGINWCYFNPRTNTVYPWFATAGALPVDGSNNTPRLICSWRTRVILSGLLEDSSMVFMSRAFVNGETGNQFNFDYAPVSPSGADAFAQNVGRPVTSIIPYSDDILIVGMTDAIKVFRGDPVAGGQLDLVTEGIGMAWGEPWCMDPYGVVYFVSNRMQVYAFDPRGQGNKPIRISQAIQSLLIPANTGSQGIRLVWDDRYEGLHVFITTLTAATSTDQHFFYEKEANAWWVDTFANKYHNPLCCCVLDGNLQENRTVLLGGWDGFVRMVDPEATDDDGTAIDSEVLIGPFLTKYGDSVMLKELQPILATESGDVDWSVYVGQTAEEAINRIIADTDGEESDASGTWSAGRGFTEPVMRAGYAAYARLRSRVPWAMESIRCIVDAQGAVARRGK